MVARRRGVGTRRLRRCSSRSATRARAPPFRPRAPAAWQADREADGQASTGKPKHLLTSARQRSSAIRVFRELLPRAKRGARAQGSKWSAPDVPSYFATSFFQRGERLTAEGVI